MNMLLTLKRGQQITREAVLSKLVDMLYERNDIAFQRGRFRVRGDVVEVHPANADEEAHPHRIFRRRNRPHHALRSPHRPRARRS